MAYFCDDCGEEFSEPHEYEERHPYGDTYASEYFASSPCCDSTFNEGQRCPRCEGKFSSNTKRDYCSDCIEEAEYAWSSKTDKEKFSICIAFIKDAGVDLHNFLSEYDAELTRDPVNTTITKFTISYVLVDTIDDEFIEFLVQENEI